MDFTRQVKNGEDTLSIKASLMIGIETWHVVGEDVWWQVFMVGAWLEIRPGMFNLNSIVKDWESHDKKSRFDILGHKSQT